MVDERNGSDEMKGIWMRHYTWNSDDQTVLVTERNEDETAAPFILSMEDAKWLERYFHTPRTHYGVPTVEQDGQQAALKIGDTTIYLHRGDWKHFVEQVNSVEFPQTQVPDDVEIMLDIRASHTLTVTGEELVGSDDRYNDGMWDGDADELDQAIRDAVNDHDYADEVADLMQEIDYVDDIDLDTSW